jgi:hypothetical protein
MQSFSKIACCTEKKAFVTTNALFPLQFREGFFGEKKMFELSKSLVAALESFILSIFVVTDEGKDLTIFREKAFTSLKRLFFNNDFELVPNSVESKRTKGAKTVAHNAFDNEYIRVTSPRCDCPIVIKPIFSGESFLTYFFAPDTVRVQSLAQLESFCKTFETKASAKHETFEKLAIACTARQIGEDRGNNTRQRLQRISEKMQEQEKRISAFVALPTEIWEATKPALAGMFDADEASEIMGLIEEKRALLFASIA